MKRLHSTSQLGKEMKNQELLAEIFIHQLAFATREPETLQSPRKRAKASQIWKVSFDDINPLNMLYVIERRTYLDTPQSNWR